MVEAAIAKEGNTVPVELASIDTSNDAAFSVSYAASESLPL